MHKYYMCDPTSSAANSVGQHMSERNLERMAPGAVTGPVKIKYIQSKAVTE